MTGTLKEFLTNYKGFDFDHGVIVLVKKSTCHNFIIEKGGCWCSMLNKYSDANVWGWNHSGNVMVITIDV